MRIAATYALLAAIAIAANISAQDLVIRVYQGQFDVSVSILAGTGVGLVVKYVLDKRFIFDFRAQNPVHDARVLAQYTMTGAITTAIFWGFAFGFHWTFQTKELRYLGGAIGLTLGYMAKYQLDKKYIFHAGRA